jgi:hypothetical protein
MVGVGPTAVVVLILIFVFTFLYFLADKVDKEEELRKNWERYNKEYEEWWMSQWQ